MTLEEFKLWFDGYIASIEYWDDAPGNYAAAVKLIKERLDLVVAPEPIQSAKQQVTACPWCLGKGVVCNIPGGMSFACPVCMGKGEL